MLLQLAACWLNIYSKIIEGSRWFGNSAKQVTALTAEAAGEQRTAALDRSFMHNRLCHIQYKFNA